MGYASLYFPNGPGIRFRIDPMELGWNFTINTSVTPTIGGRVVQVTGATLSDLLVAGLFGEDRAAANGEVEHPGRSWRLAVRFSKKIREMMQHQSDPRLNHPTAVFSYPPLDLRFRVYVKDYRDPDGGTISISPGRFSHGYELTLFIVKKESVGLTRAGEVEGIIDKARANAIDQYIQRIGDGIGWKPSAFNGTFLDYYKNLFPTNTSAGRPGGQEALDQDTQGFR